MGDSSKYYEPIEIIKFEKLSDDIVHVGKSLILRINVNLAKSYNGNRYYFYKEYEYNLGGYSRVSIKKCFDYYLSLEDVYKPKDREKLFIRIGLSEFYGLSSAVNSIVEWFTSDKYKKLFAKNHNEIVIAMTPIPTKTLSNLPMGISITFMPAVIGVGDEQKPGVKLLIESDSSIMEYEMGIDHVFALYSALKNFNMFTSAQVMVASLGIPLGTNRINLDNESKGNPLPSLQDEPKIPKGSSIEGRFIGGPKLETM